MNAELELRRRRLAETIAWCSLQKLQNNPPESDEIKARRALGERAVNHAYAAYQLEASSPFKWVTRGQVKQMQAEAMQMRADARLEEIRPLASQLRAPALSPPGDFSYGKDEGALAGAVEAVCEVRARRVVESRVAADAGALGLGGGKLLRYFPQQKMSDNSAAYESKGFFDDEHSAPPWDTWVCAMSGVIVAFVPRMLCGLAQRGTEVDLAQCIRWADSRFVADTFGAIGR